jgi:hypothetical protein
MREREELRALKSCQERGKNKKYEYGKERNIYI